EASKARIPPEARAVMERSIDDLRASGIMARIVAVGQKAADFALPDAAGRIVSIADLPAIGPGLVPVHTGRSWRDHEPGLEALQQVLPEITAAGAALAVISPQVARTPRETEEPKAMDFAMLRDFGNRVAEAYGLVFTLPDDLRSIYLKFGIDLARGNGDGTW